jgi:hypothetical protein
MMLELLVELLVELFGQILIEVLWEFGAAVYRAGRPRGNRSVGVAVVGYAVAGAGLGALSLLVWPDRLLRPGSVPGLSLIISPVCAGAALHAWGWLRRRGGHATTNLATFPGGAAFAAGTSWASALARIDPPLLV